MRLDGKRHIKVGVVTSPHCHDFSNKVRRPRLSRSLHDSHALRDPTIAKSSQFDAFQGRASAYSTIFGTTMEFAGQLHMLHIIATKLDER